MSIGVCVCVYMCAHVWKTVYVRFFSSARKLLQLYQFSGETVSPSGFDENSSVNIIDKRCPIEKSNTSPVLNFPFSCSCIEE